MMIILKKNFSSFSIPTHVESVELDDAIEEKIQKIVIAFRDARKRMQSLIFKDKKTINPLS